MSVLRLNKFSRSSLFVVIIIVVLLVVWSLQKLGDDASKPCYIYNVHILLYLPLEHLILERMEGRALE
jgi:hypothetical protein